MTGKLIEKKEIIKGTLRVSFQIPEPINFKPGQYMFVILQNPKFEDDRGNKRQFSILNSPNNSNVLTMTTRISESGFKKSLLQLSIGSEVQIGPIAGVFTLPDNTTKPLVFIAGGIGITPFMSMLSYISVKNLPYSITLIYSNRNQASTAYLKEIQNFSATIPNLKLILTMTQDNEWTGEKRIIDSQFIKDYFPTVNENLYMVVGPPLMVEAVKKALTLAGVSIDNIKFENFTGY